jgi:hypothetical protein
MGIEAGARGNEKHLFAVNAPADRHVFAGMIRQAFGYAAVRRNYIEVLVAVILTFECDHRAVR